MEPIKKPKENPGETGKIAPETAPTGSQKDPCFHDPDKFLKQRATPGQAQPQPQPQGTVRNLLTNQTLSLQDKATILAAWIAQVPKHKTDPSKKFGKHHAEQPQVSSPSADIVNLRREIDELRQRHEGEIEGWVKYNQSVNDWSKQVQNIVRNLKQQLMESRKTCESLQHELIAKDEVINKKKKTGLFGLFARGS